MKDTGKRTPRFSAGPARGPEAAGIEVGPAILDAAAVTLRLRTVDGKAQE